MWLKALSHAYVSDAIFIPEYEIWYLEGQARVLLTFYRTLHHFLHIIQHHMNALVYRVKGKVFFKNVLNAFLQHLNGDCYGALM